MAEVTTDTQHTFVPHQTVDIDVPIGDKNETCFESRNNTCIMRTVTRSHMPIKIERNELNLTHFPRSCAKHRRKRIVHSLNVQTDATKSTL